MDVVVVVAVVVVVVVVVVTVVVDGCVCIDFQGNCRIPKCRKHARLKM